ncbi:ATP-dependent DNA ligase [Roseimicrobium gellanilyticum]|uniref:ATP-dependent DNA ligase n=1 Tax=Roseimicrobium gellanilyticum TaxID=748857 RepID=UPI001B883CD2|nr:ATP-dependent DNA ligase [Roseimicrobium gellanilyticum]
MSSPAHITVHYADGIYLPEPDLWLDPPFQKGRAFVSHAHSDHFARHAQTICSPVTRTLIERRYGAFRGREAISPAYGEVVEEGGYAIRLVPAGHIYGSAMLHLTRLSDGASLLYTGDFKLRQGLTAEPAELLSADTLILETTFGLPQFQFPPMEKILDQMLRFVRETLEDGGIPVLLGYSLGKAQEIISALHQAGVPVMLHESILKMTSVYRDLHPGHEFPEYEKFDAARAHGHVLVLPPSAARSQAVRRLKVCRTAMLSGWALTPGAKYRYQVDEVFPLSDHADYPELIRCVEEVKPKVVYTVHGYTSEFARDLRQRGWEAWSLVSDDQMELGLAADFVPASPRATAATSVPETTDADLRDKVLAPEAFASWCRTCERVAADSSRLKKQEHLATCLAALREENLATAARWFSGLLDDPAAQTGPLQVGWSIIRRALLQASQLREQEYRAISRQQADTGRTAYLVLQRRPGVAADGNAISIAGVATIFRNLRAARGPNEKAMVLQQALAGMPALEGSFLVRLLTGELRVGSREGLVEEAVAKAFNVDADALREAAMLSGDIGRAAVLASRDALHEAQPTLFIPIKVMLASPEETAEDIWERICGDGAHAKDDEEALPTKNGSASKEGPPRVWLEDKFDGIRAQLHRSKDGVKIFTRDLKDFTDQFPEIVQSAGDLKEEVILDGELIAFSENKKLTFHDLQKRLGRRDQGDLFVSSDITVRYIAFDLLWKNGEGLLHETLAARRQHLEALKMPRLLRRIAVTEAGSPEEVEDAFHAARRNGNEGLIAKDRHSLYTPGRRGKTWLKLKKAFSTLDVVVVKAEQGHGKRSHVLSDYTFAVREENTGALKVIGKAYSGLTDVEIETLTEHFKEHTLSQRGSVRTVTPNVVLEIAFDSIQPSQRHDSGLALRFPRIKAIRTDKTPAEIDTLAYARKLAGVGK